MRGAASSCVLATGTVLAGFAAAFPDMAVCWGLCPLDGPVLVSIWSPGDRGHMAGAAVTCEPRPHGPGRVQAGYGCDARLGGPSVSLLLAGKTDKGGAWSEPVR